MNYFSETEQSCPCCGAIKFSDGFLNDMNGLREAVGHSLAANSMCRCESHNKAVGGAKGSYHLITHPWGACAADISVNGWDGAKKWRFVKIAMSRGFSVGLANSFIHVDQRHKYAGQDPVIYKY